MKKLLVNIWARIFQAVMWVACFLLPFRQPKVIKGADSIKKIPDILKEKGYKKALVVTDGMLWQIGLVKPLLEAFDKAKFPYEVYHDVVANPTITNCNEGYEVYAKGGCDCLVAVGGGSSMDACKGVGVRVAHPDKQIRDLKGLFIRGLLAVHKKIPFMIAVPTTAGTGSETTVAAVIVDKEFDDKYAINDPLLIPKMAILDPKLLVGLPKGVSSTTGMDALTHAVEAYIGHSNTRQTKKYGYEAVVAIFKYLEKSVAEPTNLEYREAMLEASYKAGVAFTRAYVGTVHSVAHSLGGKYNVAHGLANAVILPMMLREYGKNAEHKLAKLAKAVGIEGGCDHCLAEGFIEAIDKMNANMGITNSFGQLIKDEDIDFLAKHAYHETMPLYPVPRILSVEELKAFYKKLQIK